MTQATTLDSRPTAAAVKRLGAIGVDSSHLPEFTRRIARRHADGRAHCRVTGFWTDGEHDMPDHEVRKWIDDTEQLGAQRYDRLDEMLDEVDGVLVLSVNGYKHLAHAEAPLRRGLPTYIDKPLACSVAEAHALLQLARETDAPCYSASSLRFAREIKAMDPDTLGDFAAIDAYGPGELHPLMPGVFFYGVHTVEMVDAIWGPGVAAVSAQHTEPRDILQLRYHDGRHATLRLERNGCYDFGATVHGTKDIACFRVDFSSVYDRLVEAMTRFFDEGVAPVKLEDIVENVAVMAAANQSIAQGGRWIDL